MTAAFSDAWATFQQEAGPLLADELSALAPVGDPFLDAGSGTLSRSMEWRPDDESGDLTVGSSDPRGPILAYVARGTRPHEIVPVNAGALHFFAGGNEVFAQHVNHPGTTANPFHITAWENKRQEVRSMFLETVGKGVVLSYLNPWRDRNITE